MYKSLECISILLNITTMNVNMTLYITVYFRSHLEKMYLINIIICDKMCQNEHCSHTISTFTFYHQPKINSSCVFYSQKFNDVFLLQVNLFSLACLTSARAWKINIWLHLPVQVNSQQRIATQLAGETGHEFCDTWGWKQLKLMRFGHIIFWIGNSCHFVATQNLLHHYKRACGIYYLEKNYQKG